MSTSWRTGANRRGVAPASYVLATAPGAPVVVDADTMALLKPGWFLINVGHTADEIDLSALPERRAVLPFVEACRVGDHEVYLLAGGSMTNLTAGHGDSLNAFDITSAVMVAGVGFIATVDEAWPNAVHPLPASGWRRVPATIARGQANRCVPSRYSGRSNLRRYADESRLL